MKRYFTLYTILLILFLKCGGQQHLQPIQPIKGRIALKTLVVDDKSSSDPRDVVIKLRWSFDPKMFNPKDVKARFRFPECGVTVYRKKVKDKKYLKLGKFNLPASKFQLMGRILKISDQKLIQRLFNGAAGKLTKDGDSLFTAIKASQKGKKDNNYTVDPMNLLMMASLNPDMGEILGLFYEDTLKIKQNETLMYKLVGAWDWGKGCISTILDSIERKVVVKTDPPLPAPGWIGQSDSLKQLRKIDFDKEIQKVTYYWDSPQGKQLTPSPVTLDEPVVKIQWWKDEEDYVGFHIDRWKSNGNGVKSPAIRVNVFPRFKCTLPLEYIYELDRKRYSAELRNLLRKKGIPLSGKAFIEVSEKGNQWLIVNTEDDPTDRYLLSKEDNKLNVYKLDPYLILSSGDTQKEIPENFVDAFLLKPDSTYLYRIIAVDIFGRESVYSQSRSITIQPIDFPPISPQRVCLESFDPYTNTLLSKSCPQKIGNSYTWLTPADLKQKQNTEEIWIKLKWQWTKEQQKRFKASSFNVYQDQITNMGDHQDNDYDGKVDEEFPNGMDDDNDSQVDEDLAVTGKLVAQGIKIVENKENYEKVFQLKTRDSKTNVKKPVRYFYYAITTVSLNIDDDNDGLRDEDGFDGIDNDGDLKTDEDPPVSQSGPSIPVMAYVVDKVPPNMPKSTCLSNAWLTATIDPFQTPDWENKLAVHLEWSNFLSSNPQIGNDIDGFNLYRSVDEKNYMRLNRELIETPVYLDHIESTAQNKFYYKLEIVDEAGNVSAKSGASCPIQLPDKVPPTPAIIIAVNGGNEQITLECEKSSSADASEYYFYRDVSKGNVKNRTKDKKNRLNNIPKTVAISDGYFTYTDNDPLVEAGKNYYYIVEAIDKAGNRSFSPPAAGRAYDATPPMPPTNLSAKIKIVKPKIVSKENSLIKVTRITPAKVAVGERMFGKVQIKIKQSRIEYVSFSEDPHGPMIPTGDLFKEWHNPDRDSEVTFEYELNVPSDAAPGKYELWGDAKAVQSGLVQEIKQMISEIEVIATGISKTTVKLSWKLPEKETRAAVYRCEGGACVSNGGYWSMITPLLPANQEYYEDTFVQIGNTYHYKVRAYDKVGNRGNFSNILKVKVQ